MSSLQVRTVNTRFDRWSYALICLTLPIVCADVSAPIVDLNPPGSQTNLQSTSIISVNTQDYAMPSNIKNVTNRSLKLKAKVRGWLQQVVANPLAPRLVPVDAAPNIVPHNDLDTKVDDPVKPPRSGRYLPCLLLKRDLSPAFSLQQVACSSWSDQEAKSTSCGDC